MSSMLINKYKYVFKSILHACRTYILLVNDKVVTYLYIYTYIIVAMLIQADDVEAQLDRSTCFFYRATQHDKAPNHQIKKTTRFFFPTNQPPEYSIKLDFA